MAETAVNNWRGNEGCCCCWGDAMHHIVMCACVDVRRGSCWVTVVDDRCEGSVHSHITKAECCSSRVGLAWGSPCEKCPQYDELVAAIGLHATVSPSIAPGEYTVHY